MSTKPTIDEIALGGDDPHIEFLAFSYLTNLANHTEHRSKSGYVIAHAAERIFDDTEDYGINFPKKENIDEKGPVYPLLRGGKKNKVSGEDWENLKNYFLKRKKEAEDHSPQALYENLKRLTDRFGLSDLEKEVLDLIYVLDGSGELKEVIDTFIQGDPGLAGAAFARMLGKPNEFKNISKIIGSKGRLVRFGIIEDPTFSVNDFSLPTIDTFLREHLHVPELSDEEIDNLIFVQAPETDVNLNDFRHIKDLDRLVRYIKAKLESGEKGINIILHGPPGSGKTALASAIAKHLNVPFYAAEPKQDEEDDIESDTKTSRIRMNIDRRLQALLQGKPALILSDEIEDWLLKGTDSSKSADTDSKVDTNRMLETNPIIRICTCNDINKFHEAVRQRFSYSLYVNYQPTMVRKQIWEKHLGNHPDYHLDDTDVLKLARKFAPPPRIIKQVVDIAATLNADFSHVGDVIRMRAKSVYMNSDALEIFDCVPENFDTRLIESSDNFDEKTANIIEKGKEGIPFSLLVDGVEGTGKTSLLRYIAEQIGLSVFEYDMADLATPDKQMSAEQKIASVFNKAADEDSFLIINGIEEIVPNPHSNGERWDDSLVKTFIECASIHKIPFAATTEMCNGSRIGQRLAAVFSDTLSVKTLSPEKALFASEAFFGKKVTGLDGKDGYCLGDFRAVQILLERGIPDNDNNIVAQLDKHREMRNKHSSSMHIAA